MFVRPYQSVRLLMINKKLNTGTVDIMFQIKTIIVQKKFRRI